MEAIFFGDSRRRGDGIDYDCLSLSGTGTICRCVRGLVAAVGLGGLRCLPL